MENKQQTPLQKAISKIESEIEIALIDINVCQREIDKMYETIDILKELLPYEREVIGRTYDIAFERGEDYGDGYIGVVPNGNDYFTQTFQTNE